MIGIDEEVLKKELLDLGYTNDDFDKIFKIMVKFPIIAELKNAKLEVNAGEIFKIELINRKGETPSSEDIIDVGFFNCYINGIDSNKVVSVEIPKLTLEKCEPIKLKVEIMPFDFKLFNCKQF